MGALDHSLEFRKAYAMTYLRVVGVGGIRSEFGVKKNVGEDFLSSASQPRLVAEAVRIPQGGGRLARAGRAGGGRQTARGSLVVGGGPSPVGGRVGAGGHELAPPEEEYRSPAITIGVVMV